MTVLYANLSNNPLGIAVEILHEKIAAESPALQGNGMKTKMKT